MSEQVASIAINSGGSELTLQLTDLVEGLDAISVDTIPENYASDVDEPEVVISFDTDSMDGRLWLGNKESTQEVIDELQNAVNQIE